MNEFIISSVAHGKVNHGPPTVRPNLPWPQQITFKLDAKMTKYIDQAIEHYNELVGQHDLHVSLALYDIGFHYSSSYRDLTV